VSTPNRGGPEGTRAALLASRPAPADVMRDAIIGAHSRLDDHDDAIGDLDRRVSALEGGEHQEQGGTEEEP
jgi:hypothetical protein